MISRKAKVMICSRCGNDVASGYAACPRCGAPLQVAASTPNPAPAGPPVAQHAAGAAPAFRFNAARWSRAEQIAGIATLVLFISLFLPWFGVKLFGISATADALSAHGYLYLVLILCLAIAAFLIARAGFEEMPLRMPLTPDQILLTATSINLLLVLIAFLFKPGGGAVSWQFGAFIGLAAAIVAVVPLAGPAIQAGRTSRAGS